VTYLLDTGTWVAVIENRSASARRMLAAALAAHAALSIPAIALFELWFGVARSAPSRRAVNEARLRQFLSGPLEILSFEPDDARAAGQIREVLRTAGTPIGAYDLLIAGQALSRGLSVVTSNLREFRRIDGLGCVDWCAG
jgi:tRNA(fMet)-specific endonuclease VapC